MDCKGILSLCEYKKHDVMGGYKFRDVIDTYYCYTADNLYISSKKEQHKILKELDKLDVQYTPYYSLNMLMSINFNCSKEEFERRFLNARQTN